MAILNEIRQRSMFLILIIGLALFAFVLDPSSLADFFGSNKVNQVGEINGETISREDFAKKVEQYKANAGSSISQTQATNAVWSQLVSDKIYADQLEKSGIVIGETDVWNAIINAPSVQNNPAYKNEAGLFNEDKFKEAIALIKDNATGKSATNQAKSQWMSWLDYEKNVEQNLKKQAYTNLVKSGLGASLKDAERNYIMNNTKIDGQFVFVPYTSIADSLVKVTNTDIKNYIASHKATYTVDASKNLKYVKFDTKASAEDEAVIKDALAANIDEFKKSTDDLLFIDEVKSDLANNPNFIFKSQLPKSISDQITTATKGTVIGPYKETDYFKISKITDVVKMPDSVKASHILIPFIGSRSASAETIDTEKQAKKKADSIVAIVKRSPSKFKELAKLFSADKSNADKGGDLNWFTYNAMVPEFRDFSFTHNKGDVGVVKTAFGFHIVKIDNQKNKQNAYKLATIAKKIVPSEMTESKVYETVESFLAALTDNADIDALAKEKGYTVNQGLKIKVLQETIPGLQNQRAMVNWAFNQDTKIGSSKRFDLDNGGFAVAVLTGSTDKGLAPVADVAAQVRPIIAKKKKAALLSSKMEGATLEAIATANNVTVRSVSGVTLQSPTLSGVGAEPAVVGAMYALKDGNMATNIVGNKGVFAVKTTHKEKPVALPNYSANRENLSNQMKAKSGQLFNALKKAANVEDYRSNLY